MLSHLTHHFIPSRPVAKNPSPRRESCLNEPPAPLRDVRWEPPIPGSKWIRRQVVEHMPEPLSPLFEELYLREGLERSIDALMPILGMPDTLEQIMERPFFGTVNGYAYMRADVKMAYLTLLRAMAAGIPIAIMRLEILPALRFTSAMAHPTSSAAVVSNNPGESILSPT